MICQRNAKGPVALEFIGPICTAQLHGFQLPLHANTFLLLISFRNDIFSSISEPASGGASCPAQSRLHHFLNPTTQVLNIPSNYIPQVSASRCLRKCNHLLSLPNIDCLYQKPMPPNVGVGPWSHKQLDPSTHSAAAPICLNSPPHQ